MKRQEEEITRLDWMHYEQAIKAITYEQIKEVLSRAYVYLSKKYHFEIDEGKMSSRDPESGKMQL